MEVSFGRTHLLDCDHVFFDPDAKAESGRHGFTGDEKIPPANKKSSASSPLPQLSSTISVHKLQKRERDTLGESIVVVRIEYADGSVWQRP